MIFIQNKYTHIYNSIISNAKSRHIPDTYIEHHHIIPRSLGGNDEPDNLVALTAREHFIVHRLLVKMTKGEAKSAMVYAIWMMANIQSKQFVTSRLFEALRIAKIEAGFSDETKAKMSAAKKGKALSDEIRAKISAGQIGRIVSDETRAKISAAQIGRIIPDETKAKMSASQTGRIISDETKAKMSAARKGKTHSNETKAKMSAAKRKARNLRNTLI